MKHCNGCDKYLELDGFGKDCSKPDGHRHKCKKCRNDLRRENRKKDPEKFLIYERKDHVRRSNKNSSLVSDYGITIEEFEQMEIDQDNKCMICKKREDHKQKRGLSVDHCHDTLEVRGLLCHRCNCGIGLLNEDIIILEEAIKYLKGELK